MGRTAKAEDGFLSGLRGERLAFARRWVVSPLGLLESGEPPSAAGIGHIFYLPLYDSFSPPKWGLLMIDRKELLARLSRYQLMRALMSNAADRAALDEHIAELERQFDAAEDSAPLS